MGLIGRLNLFMHIDKSSFSDAARNGIDSDAGVRSILGRDRGSGVYLLKKQCI